MLTRDPPASRLLAAAPLYVQIAEALLERIEAGELVPGDRLPPERELSEHLGVNRLTLRRALWVLESQGLLNRQQGRGTFVAEPKYERQASRLVSFNRGMQHRGVKPRVRLISTDQRPVEASLAKELRLPVAAPVYVVVRCRSIHHEPVLLERYTLPVRRFPRLLDHDLEGRSVYEVLETEYGVRFSRARQSLEPVIATEYEAELLSIHPGAPLMLERRLSYDHAGDPIEHGRDLYRGDRFRFVTESAPWEAEEGSSETRGASPQTVAAPSDLDSRTPNRIRQGKAE
jgi:GntR family transcriptional regulator